MRQSRVPLNERGSSLGLASKHHYTAPSVIALISSLPIKHTPLLAPRSWLRAYKGSAFQWAVVASRHRVSVCVCVIRGGAKGDIQSADTMPSPPEQSAARHFDFSAAFIDALSA
jgi:hypothetical protein